MTPRWDTSTPWVPPVAGKSFGITTLQEYLIALLQAPVMYGTGSTILVVLVVLQQTLPQAGAMCASRQGHQQPQAHGKSPTWDFRAPISITLTGQTWGPNFMPLPVVVVTSHSLM